MLFYFVHSLHSFPDRPARRDGYDAHLALLKDVRALGIDPRARAWLGRDAVTEAAERGLTEVVTVLSSMGADVSRPDQRGLTPLRAAVFADRKETARALIGTDPGDFFAQVAMDNVETVLGMLELRPDLANAILDMEGGKNCALATAIDHAGEAIIRLLLNKDADPNGPARRWSSILHAAVHRGLPVDLLAFMIDKGAPLDRGDGDGNTPLNLAARRGDVPVAKLLLDRGGLRELHDRTRLHAAHLRAGREDARVPEEPRRQGLSREPISGSAFRA